MPQYFEQLNDCFAKTEASGPNRRRISVEKAIGKAVRQIATSAGRGNKVAIIGNGGSAAIASHTAIDFLKNAQVPAIAFNDASFLTCLTNDLGYDAVFAKPISILSQRGDILIAISSSGRSSNILKAVKAAKGKKNFIITLSGFSRTNFLRKMGDINFYVPSFSYGFVEITHSVICHWISDRLMHPRAHG